MISKGSANVFFLIFFIRSIRNIIFQHKSLSDIPFNKSAFCSFVIPQFVKFTKK